jgi:hypothetical protein
MVIMMIIIPTTIGMIMIRLIMEPVFIPVIIGGTQGLGERMLDGLIMVVGI